LCIQVKLFSLCLADDFVVVFVALGISASHRPLDSTISFPSRGHICFLLCTLMIKNLLLSLPFLPAIVVYYSVGTITKPMRHPFWIASEWATERGICDEPRVRTRFWCNNPIVLRCIIAGHAIREQQGYAAEISFGLVAHQKSILCQSLLGGFRTYPFL
jgi:hypothetical protein